MELNVGASGSWRKLYWEHQVGGRNYAGEYQVLEGNYIAIGSIRYVKGVVISIREGRELQLGASGRGSNYTGEYQLLEGNYSAIGSIRYVKGVAINIR